MNESDFLRGQLSTERAHLHEILNAVRAGTASLGHARPVALYVEWSQRRLVQQLRAHQAALEAAPALTPGTRAQLAALDAALARVGDTPGAQLSAAQAGKLLALIEAWDEPLDRLAGKTLKISHWRQAAHLSADTILEERQLYAAARGAVGGS